MSDDLLAYYNRELSIIRRLGAEFAAAHPKIAGRLRLGPDTSEDPHVSRLIEAFAYLNARIRHKLDDEFPELAEGMLAVLYPHYLAPIPSMAIVQFHLDPAETELAPGYTIPQRTPLETAPVQNIPCRFRTCYPVTLWPVRVDRASLTRPPFVAPVVPSASGRASSLLTLTLRGLVPATRFADLPLSALRFFLAGQIQNVYSLYELIFRNTLAVVVANGPDDPNPVVLDKSCLRAVGFDRDEGLLPYSARSFLGYRLLTEFFVFPEKFLFVDFCPPRGALSNIENRLDIYLYLDREAPNLEPDLSADSFRLGCTPIVNLYRQRAEPIQLTHAEHEYRVVPDARRPLSHEVYGVDRVIATSPRGEELEYQPLFSAKHAAAGESPAYWFSSRRAGDSSVVGDQGTEVYLTLVNPALDLAAPADWTLFVETTCLNRDLPSRLPFGGNQPRFHIGEGKGLVTDIRCLTPPTKTLRPSSLRGIPWRLISHLTLNHSSLQGDEAAEALRDMLRLYDFTKSEETQAFVKGILSVRSRGTVGRPSSRSGSICRGVEISIEFDEARYATLNSLFLFASVLDRFLALYCSMNSFSRFVATTRGRSGEYHRWPPRMGERTLL
jgi:type VI secretion system protein ImpG